MSENSGFSQRAAECRAGRSESLTSGLAKVVWARHGKKGGGRRGVAEEGGLLPYVGEIFSLW